MQIQTHRNKMTPLHAVIELHAIVSGQVQGVGFRAKVYTHATQIGLTGSVCNLANGSVEIYAQGTKEQLTQLLTLLQEDAGRGWVSRISTDYNLPSRTYTDFAILKNRSK